MFDQCRICGCSAFDPCAERCIWAERGLCTVCDEMRGHIIDYVSRARRSSKRSLMRLFQEGLDLGHARARAAKERL